MQCENLKLRVMLHPCTFGNTGETTSDLVKIKINVILLYLRASKLGQIMKPNKPKFANG